MTSVEQGSELLHEVQQVWAQAECLATPLQVENALDKMAAGITARLAQANPLVLTVMNGGLVLAGRLLPRLPFPLEMDYVHATRYGDAYAGGEVLHWRVPLSREVAGRSVLILDDILDEGYTLLAIIAALEAAGAQEVLSAVLVDKLHTRKAREGLQPDFFGLRLPDRFLFGCGMDYKGYWRNAPGVYALPL